MLIMRKSAYAAAAIIGAAALATTLTTSARASSWEYGYGFGNTAQQAHGAAVNDLVSSWSDCIDVHLVSDTRDGNSWDAVEAGFCAGPR